MKEFPQTHMDPSRPRKRPRSPDSDTPPPPASEAQEVGNKTSFAATEHATSSLSTKEDAQNGSPPGQDDSDDQANYIIDRYKIHSDLGEGSFGVVKECWDKERNEMVAIKLTRCEEEFREAAENEINVLQELEESDTNGSHFVKMLDWFDYDGSLHIVLEKLGPRLYDLMEINKFSAFPLDIVREFGRQLLESIAIMHKLDLIHVDLKPENILHVSDLEVSSSFEELLPKLSNIKVIDFSNTCHGPPGCKHLESTPTAPYCAPEIILGLGWNRSLDIWSIGCILLRLCSEAQVLWAFDRLERLVRMERVLGPLPQSMFERVEGPVSDKYIIDGCRLNWPNGALSEQKVIDVSNLRPLQELVIYPDDDIAKADLVNLLRGLLRYEPLERLTAQDALKHPFFTKTYH